MTTRATSILTNTYNGVPPANFTVNIALNAGDVTIGSNLTTTIIPRPTSVKVITPSVRYLSSQVNTLTVAQLIETNIVVSLFSSANPSTVNDNITVNLPTATAELEGMFFFFRKMRGAISASGVSWTFTTPTATIVSIQTTANATGQPVASITQSAFILRLVVCGTGGVYYWTFI